MPSCPVVPGGQSTASTSKHSYPSSSKKQTNWDAIAKQVQEEEDKPQDDKDPNAGGDKELNKLFQKLYAGATDEQKKAMIKSYQEYVVLSLDI